MDVAQTYLQNSCSWTSWCASDSNTNKRKRIRLENGDHAAVKYAETEQAWSGVDELTGDLPAVQLNHLGVEMQQDYNIGDEFLVFDSFNNFKQEIPSPPNTAENHMLRQYSPVENVHHKKYTNTEQPDREYSPRKLPSSASSSPSSCYSPSCNNANDVKQHNDCQVYNKDNSSYCREHVTTPNTVATCPSSPDALDDSFRFQYVLCAATSIAMKINEETLTYLNQGQPYEIKLKKLGDLTQLRGKVFKSIIRVLFHDRRLQYMERQQMSAWQASRPGDKILQLDLPLSYGIFDHFQDPNALNAVQFLWDPTKEVGVYIKVNCISTEFTAKKHGGEKGVPFRIQIETYTHEKNPRSLHMASCQIKVFKLKGADRKHKQDREKIMKKSPIERENYQNSYECTVFTDMCPSGDPLSPCATINSSVTSSPGNPDSDGGLNNGSVLSTFDYDSNFNDNIGADSFSQVSPRDSATSTGADFTKKICAFNLPVSTPLPEIHNWLRFHRFGAYLSSLENYSVSDLLQLSEERLIQLCGLGDGIRLFNAFSNRTAPRHMSPLPSAPQIPPTKLIVYVTTEVNSNYYMPVYLKSLTSAELVNKMAPIFGLNASQIHSAVLHEPQGPYIIITDEVVQDIKDRTYFFGEISNNTNGGLIKIFLKQVFHNK